jgi:deoxyribonuclease IV
MLNIGYSINLPNNYDKKIKEYFNSIQIMFLSTKISINDINNINKFLKNNKHLKYIFIHSSYKINIGSDIILNKNGFFSNSFELFQNEINYMKKFKLNNIIIHTGKNKGNIFTKEHVLNNMYNFIKYSLDTFDINIILETSSGQGSETLSNLEDFIKFILKFKNHKKYKNLGICIDTCHIFQAGYDLNNSTTIKKIHKMFRPIENKIKVIHLNDSYYEMGMKIDRHENIGEGYIKVDKLKKFISKYNKIPLILETSKSYKKQMKLIM